MTATVGTFKVVHNDEGQYSIYPSEMANPPGWLDEGTTGGREACLEHIGRIWTDLRPRSLRAATADRRASSGGSDV